MALRTSDYDHAARVFEKALSLYGEGGDTHAAARVSGLRAVVDSSQGRIDEAIDRMEAA